jgi:hypothetical protein
MGGVVPPIPLVRRLGTAVAVAAAGIAFAGAPARAASAPPFTVRVQQANSTAPFFRVDARPGALANAGRLVVRNQRGRTIRVRVDPLDAVTASTLGSAYELRGSRVHGSTHWLRLGARTLTLAPREEVAVPISITVPSVARPGDYLSGIGVQPAGKASETSPRKGVAVAAVQRYAVGVEVRLPGARHPKISFTGARVERDPSRLVFLLAARNSGNVILKDVHGSARVTRGARRVAATRIRPATFVSHTGIEYPVFAPGEEPRNGTTYRVRAVMRYRGGVARLDTLVRFGRRQAVAQEHFGGPKADAGSSWWKWALAALAGLAALALAAAALVAARRRRRRGRAAALALLAGRLDAANAAGAPLSVIVLVPADAADGQKALLRSLRPRLRRSDELVDMQAQGVLIVAPDTSRETADGLAADLRRAPLAGGDLAVGSATAAGPTSADVLLDRARESAVGMERSVVPLN